jgi:hypothetical protein
VKYPGRVEAALAVASVVLVGLALVGYFYTDARFILFPPAEVSLQDHEWSVFSQFGEDGVIEKIFEIIEPGPRFAVEFGAANGIVSSNTRNLIINHGWGALLIEGDEERAQRLFKNYRDVPRVTPLHAWVFPGNVEILFEENGVPKDLDLLVIDIDSNDYYVWKVIHEFRPKVVLIEINPLFPPPQRMVIDFHPLNFWDETDYFGASFQSMYELGKRKGYEVIYCTQGINLFFVDQKYFKRFGISDNSPAALWKRPPPAVGRFLRAPQGRGDVPFEEPYLDPGPVRIEKKFIFDR